MNFVRVFHEMLWNYNYVALLIFPKLEIISYKNSAVSNERSHTQLPATSNRKITDHIVDALPCMELVWVHVQRPQQDTVRLGY